MAFFATTTSTYYLQNLNHNTVTQTKLLTDNVEIAETRFGLGRVDLAHVRALVGSLQRMETIEIRVRIPPRYRGSNPARVKRVRIPPGCTVYTLHCCCKNLREIILSKRSPLYLRSFLIYRPM
jgi:hypothetical protein